MAHNRKTIHFRDTCSLTVRQPQSSSDCLFSESFRSGCTQRNNCVQIIDVPSFFQHIHMNDDFNAVVGIFQGQQFFNIFILFCTTLGRVDFQDLVLIVSPEELIRGKIFSDLTRVFGITSDHQSKRLNDFLPISTSINFKLTLGFFVNSDAIIELFPVELLRSVFLRMEILPGYNGRNFYISLIIQRMCQRILIDHILKINFLCALLNLWSCCQFHTKNRSQFIDDAKAFISVVMVAFIHENAQIRQGLQIFKVGLT